MQEPRVTDSASQSEINETSFGRCLVDGDSDATSRARRRHRKALGISLVIEAALLALVSLSPLITTVAEPHVTRSVYLPFATITSHRADSHSKPEPPDRHPWSGNNALKWFTAAAPHQPASTTREDAVGSDTILNDIIPGPPGTEAPEFLHPRPSPPSVEAIKKESEGRPLKLSEPIVQAQLISRVEPRYPPLAIQIKLEGTVQLHAIISREGRIMSLEVVSGHPLFVQAALDAVRQWRYRPTMLNGEPVEVESTITVFFRLQR